MHVLYDKKIELSLFSPKIHINSKYTAITPLKVFVETELLNCLEHAHTLTLVVMFC